jgi:oligopeptide/dipeptide ABC transporter ATP-binding protein
MTEPDASADGQWPDASDTAEMPDARAGRRLARADGGGAPGGEAPRSGGPGVTPRDNSGGPGVTPRDNSGDPGVTPGDNTVLLRTEGLTKHFHIGGMFSRSYLHAVDDVGISIGERQIVALAGESGSGKSTMARLLAKLYQPTSGEIYFQGKPLSAVRSRRDVLRYRGDVPMVFQDPFASFNPVYRVSHGVQRCLKLHRGELSARQRQEEAERVFEAVGLTPAADVLQRFPHELSGGQRQRVGFAQALALRPKLILADEPVSMLDVSIRIGLLNLMAQLRDEQGVSILYITHDIASARYVADRLIIMYAGRVAEQGPTEEVLASPRHPYTQLLVSAVPDPRAPLGVGAETDRGEPPRVIDPAPGCRFRWRCPLAIDECHRVTPELSPLGPDHEAACHVARSGAEVKAFG